MPLDAAPQAVDCTPTRQRANDDAPKPAASPALTAALRCTAALLSDDLDEVRAAEEIARAWYNAAEDAVVAADTGRQHDYPAYERAEAAFARAEKALGMLSRRREELAEEAGWDEIREQRRDYWARVL